MARFLLSAAAILIGIWIVFAVLRALSAFVHLALVIAILLIAYSLINAIRTRASQSE